MSEQEAEVAERAMWNKQHMQACQERHRKRAMKLDAEYMAQLLCDNENEAMQDWPLYIREA